MDNEEMEQAKIKMADYSYEDLASFAKDWAEANDMDADMMQGLLQMGINTYENVYAGYALSMQAYSNHQEKNKEE